MHLSILSSAKIYGQSSIFKSWVAAASGDSVVIGSLFAFDLMLYVPVNSYGHVGTVSSPYHTFFLDKLD